MRHDVYNFSRSAWLNSLAEDQANRRVARPWITEPLTFVTLDGHIGYAVQHCVNGGVTWWSVMLAVPQPEDGVPTIADVGYHDAVAIYQGVTWNA